MESRSFKLFQVFLSSLISPLITYLVNTTYDLQGGWGLLFAGIGSLSLISFMTYRAISSMNEPLSWIYYVFAMGMFSSAIDIFIGLENDGIVSGFMTNYLKSGEPYLKTVHGTMICYFDGTFHYAMYIIMLYLISKRKSHWQVGLYWVGSIGQSMIVFMPGNILGHHSIHPSILLNIPYCIFPLLSAIHFFNQRPNSAIKTSSFSCKKMNFTFILLFTVLIIISIFRGFTALEPESHKAFMSYVDTVEPYLLHQNVYPKMQMLVIMFLFVPLYLLCIIWLLDPKLVESIKKWSLILSGGSLQAQLVHIMSSIRLNWDFLKAPMNHPLFWFNNLMLLIVPHLFLIYLKKSDNSTTAKIGIRKYK